MEDKTPAQTAAMEISASRAENVKPNDVKVEMGASGSVPKTATLAHVLAAVVSGVIALCVAAVLADGKSVIVLKPPSQLPVITESNLRVHGIHYRLDELLGQTYGVGLHHDQSGRSWTHVGAGESLKELLANLGAPVVGAALPYVISTDGAKPRSSPRRQPPGTRACRDATHRAATRRNATRRADALRPCPPRSRQCSSTRCRCWAASTSSWPASRR